MEAGCHHLQPAAAAPVEAGVAPAYFEVSGSMQGLSPASLQPLAALAKQAPEAHSSAARLLQPAALPPSWPAGVAGAGWLRQACRA